MLTIIFENEENTVRPLDKAIASLELMLKNRRSIGTKIGPPPIPAMVANMDKNTIKHTPMISMVNMPKSDLFLHLLFLHTKFGGLQSLSALHFELKAPVAFACANNKLATIEHTIKIRLLIFIIKL